MQLVLNPLSANGQCTSVEQCYAAIKGYVDFCEFCLPALTKKRIELIYDRHIEQRTLLGEDGLTATIARLRELQGGPDVVRNWYIFTRNRSRALPVENTVAIQLEAKSFEPVTGSVHLSTSDEFESWISLAGDSVCDSESLTVRRGETVRTVRNAADPTVLKSWLPSFEPNPKHRREGYMARGGEYVSPMPLDDQEANALALVSIADSSDRRWAYHEKTRTFYCFRKTYGGREVYHGYTVEKDDVPAQLIDALCNP